MSDEFHTGWCVCPKCLKGDEHIAKNDIARTKRRRSRRAQLRQLQKAYEHLQYYNRLVDEQSLKDRERADILRREYDRLKIELDTVKIKGAETRRWKLWRRK